MAARSRLTPQQWQVVEQWMADRLPTSLTCPICTLVGPGNWIAALERPLLHDPAAPSEAVVPEEILQLHCRNCHYLLSFVADPIFRQADV